ncbi:hypothetical protein CLAIMM_05911 [Cladophialophora immunda]|nr:hypothetical protein CLAIMM_05911 [Cladophialophora immunda]
MARGAVVKAGGFRSVLAKMTWPLFFCSFVTAMLNMLFGFDTTSFAGVQSIPAFERQFGTPSGTDGSYALSASRASFISSVAFAGKFCGTLTAPLYIERIGHRYTIWVLCLISFIGVILECTAHKVSQFVIGRIVVYYSVGLAENTSTTYQSEIVPGSLRGAVVGSIQLFIQFGQIMAAGVNNNFSTTTTSKGWIIPVSIQAIVPVILVFTPPFLPSGPRWLIFKGRKDEAIKTLERVRPKEDVAAGACKEEADAIQEAMRQETEKGPWLDLFRGTNLRRTEIATIVFILQQFTGQGFVSQYSPRFYKTVGLGANAFKYNIASSTVAWAGVAIGMCLFDTVGRRNMLIIGAIGQAVFLFSMAGIGQIKNPTVADGHGLVACVMLFNFFFSGTWAPLAYVIASEIGTGRSEKRQWHSAAPSMWWPLGSVVATFYAYFRVPEIAHRSLEELDELFHNHVPARKFAATETHGAGRRIAELENERLSKGGTSHTEDTIDVVPKHEIDLD